MIQGAKEYIEEHMDEVDKDPVLFLKNTPARFFVDVHNALIASGVIDHYEAEFYVHYCDGESDRYPASAKTLQGAVDAAIKILAERNEFLQIGVEGTHGCILSNTTIGAPRTGIVEFSDGSIYKISFSERPRFGGTYMWKEYDHHERIK